MQLIGNRLHFALFLYEKIKNTSKQYKKINLNFE